MQDRGEYGIFTRNQTAKHNHIEFQNIIQQKNNQQPNNEIKGIKMAILKQCPLYVLIPKSPLINTSCKVDLICT